MAYSLDEKTIQQVKDFLLAYHKKYQKVAQISEVEKALKIEYRIIQLCYRALEDKGFFKRNYSQYKFDNVQKMQESKIKQFKENLKKVEWDNIFIIILRIVFLLVGIGAIVMSMIFTYKWGIDRFGDSFLAFVLSLTLIVFSVCAFQVCAIYLGNGQKGYAFIYFLMWFIVLIFSMQSTVAYLYNSRSRKQEQVMIAGNDVTRESMQWNELLKRESEKEIDIKGLKERLVQLNTLLGQYDSEEKITSGKKVYDDTNKKVSEQEKKIAVAEKELKAIRDNKDKFLSKEQKAGVVQQVKSDDFYQWVASIFGISGDGLEFTINCFPAVFVDIVAPLSINVSLFLRRREKKKSRFVLFLEKIFLRRKEGR